MIAKEYCVFRDVQTINGAMFQQDNSFVEQHEDKNKKITVFERGLRKAVHRHKTLLLYRVLYVRLTTPQIKNLLFLT